MLGDDQYLHHAIRLAMNGRGHVEPNPMVGCVIVKNDRIIGEGFHQQYGHPHAEPQALASCSESPEGATAYVTLEPCCHTNKQTPPCAPRLIAAKIARVVVGCVDPNPDVNGKGVAMLRKAGIVVDPSPLEAECRQLIAPFIKRTQHRLPYITMKWAESADGKIAGAFGKRVQISNAASSHQVQLLRSRCDGIVVGINTVLNDDPVLLPKNVPMLRRCKRFVLDRNLRLPVDSQLVKTIDRGPMIVCTDRSPSPILQAAGVQFADSQGWLNDQSLSHVLIEPGPTLAAGLFSQTDRLWVIRSACRIEDSSAPSAAVIPDYFKKVGQVELQGDVLSEYLNTKSPVYFAPVPSADLNSVGEIPTRRRKIPSPGTPGEGQGEGDLELR